ncbi:MAG: DUF937 domain-containing protein [Kofleriaceae bacterium]|nr:DUF937 domain-containing protein [Myxococcales bacterium]MCB9563910.1 DUF937 domain-containing protein [Kofleriaceae bacterium]
MDLTNLIKEQGGGVVGQLTKKFGIGADQAKQALDQIIPFFKKNIAGRLSLPGSGASLLGKIKTGDFKAFAHDPSKLDDDDAVAAKAKGLLGELDADEQEAHVQEVARSTGLDPAVVRQMMPAAAVATAGAMDADGALAEFESIHGDLMSKLSALGVKKDG